MRTPHCTGAPAPNGRRAKVIRHQVSHSLHISFVCAGSGKSVLSGCISHLSESDGGEFNLTWPRGTLSPHSLRTPPSPPAPPRTPNPAPRRFFRPTTRSRWSDRRPVCGRATATRAVSSPETPLPGSVAPSLLPGPSASRAFCVPCTLAPAPGAGRRRRTGAGCKPCGKALLGTLGKKAPCGNPKERRRTKACKDASGKLLRGRLSACLEPK